ncbi:MAG: hypothetical protein NC483_01150 [Ruminococcus sp.]|nr:hypothetical protein [Ruminococcus sp.]
MGFIQDIVKTVVDTGKKAIQAEVKEQTENTIETVSNKVTSTINDVGDKFQNNVKTSIDNIGNSTVNDNVGTQTINNQSYNNTVVPNNVMPQNNGVISNGVNQVTNNIPVNNQPNNSQVVNGDSKSIASDVANILEKKDIMNRDELSNNASILEKGIVDKINEATDAINTFYNKDTTLNDNTQDLAGAFEHLMKATSNIGTATDNEVGKAINQAVQDNPGFNEGLAELNKESSQIIDKIQDGINEYKDINN